MNELIRHRRLQLCLTQAELAARAGYKAPSTIAKIESGKNDIPKCRILPLAKALECTPFYLFGFTADPQGGPSSPLTAHETVLLSAYRAQPQIRPRIDRLLGILPPEKSGEKTHKKHS